MVGSQLVGLVPLKALLDVAAFYCEKENLFVLEEGQRLRLVGGAGGESGSRSGAPDACTPGLGPCLRGQASSFFVFLSVPGS